MTAGPAFEITGGPELRALGADLAKVPPAARLLLRRNLKAVAEPMKTAVQTNVLTVPVHGGKHTGLRANIARATKIRTTVTRKTVALRVWVDPKAMPAGQEKLPALFEGRGWTHAVFRPGTTVFQPGHSYFRQPAAKTRPAAAVAAEKAVVEATRPIK